MHVALTMRVEWSGPHGERRDAISHDWLALLEARGWRVDLLPNRPRGAAAWLDRVQPEGLILSGGNDVGPTPDESAPPGASVAPERDAVEGTALRWAVARRRPVLGVCRGLHVINVFFGGRLERALDGATHAGATHALELLHPTLRRWADAPRIESHSYHRQGVTAATLAPALRPLARHETVIEAVAHVTLPIVGVQWHPERRGAPAALDVPLWASMPGGFAALVGAVDDAASSTGRLTW